MTGSAWPLQVAIFGALTGNTAFMALVTGVFDNVEQDYSDFPYVTIGENIQSPFDADDFVGDENIITVHVWSRDSSYKEALVLNGLIYDILNRNNLTVSGYTTVDCIFNGSSMVELDPDGKTYHGAQEFKITLVRA